jgi:hypothetical protein
LAAFPEDDQAPDDTTRMARRFLASLRKGDVKAAHIQIAALDDITPREPRADLDELGRLKSQEGARPGHDPGTATRPAQHSRITAGHTASPATWHSGAAAPLTQRTGRRAAGTSRPRPAPRSTPQTPRAGTPAVPAALLAARNRMICA